MNKQEQFDQFHKSWTEINAAYEQYARKIGISYSLLQVLCELYHAKTSMTQKALCEICHLPKTTVNAIISGLIKQKHVKLQEMPEDRRQKSIILTDLGHQYAAPIMEKMSTSERQAFAMLDNKTIQMMLKGIEDYQKYFNQKLNQSGE
ncbi:MAG: winged helix-turn-helix transcriptional regulator [Alphaproteobacteria bacterium]|nr:winged helix-turn-helix transcriptional regulator [Alphaproteobacteria bacterium]